MKSLSLLFAFLISTQSFAGPVWEKLLRDYKISPRELQSFCIAGEDGQFMGDNPDIKVYLASTSKLLTSYWAIEELGPEYQYQTKLYLKNGQLHIQGSWDPFFGNEKMFFLLSQLYDRGYKKFNKITFDKNTIIYPGAQIHSNSYPIINKSTIATNLKNYFNTSSWSEVFKSEYRRIASATQHLSGDRKINLKVEMDADSVEFVEKNPFENESDVKVLTLSSPPLYKYLKEINIKSNNYASHTIFRQLGGANAFSKFIAEKLQVTEEQLKMYSGSGLPTTINGKRFDNYATCRSMTKMVESLNESIQRQGYALKNIMAVPGVDQGTFRRRLNSQDTANTFVAKTGTLQLASTLAGLISTKQGLKYFGIFNHINSMGEVANAKKVQDEMVKAIISMFGGPERFEYRSDSFWTFGSDIGKAYDPEALDSDFLPFESSLN